MSFHWMRIASEYQDELIQVAIWLVEWGRNIFMLSRSNTLRQPRYWGSRRRTQIPWLATMRPDKHLRRLKNLYGINCYEVKNGFSWRHSEFSLTSRNSYIRLQPVNMEQYIHQWDSHNYIWSMTKCNIPVVNTGISHIKKFSVYILWKNPSV